MIRIPLDHCTLPDYSPLKVEPRPFSTAEGTENAKGTEDGVCLKRAAFRARLGFSGG